MGAEGAVEELSGNEAAETPAVAAPATTTLPDQSASKRATRAVELAGRALDPTSPGGADLELARVLLNESLLWSAKAVTPEEAPPTTLEEALERLERAGILAKLGDVSQTRTELALLDVVPAAPDIAALELLVNRIAEETVGRKRIVQAKRVRRFGLIGLVITAAISVVVFGYFRFPSDSYSYKVSSAHRGFPTEGRIGRIYAYGLVLHTQQEIGPWMEIDLEKTRTISGLTLKNRADCCHERGLPLFVEVAGEDKVWEKVAERTAPFDKWVVKFPAREARWVRLRSSANTVLHFREVKVR
jgi:hypothetical protein